MANGTVLTKEMSAESGIANEAVVTITRRNAGLPKRQGIPTLWRILGNAKKTFNAQIIKDNNMKLKCIERFVATETNDGSKFWGEFMRFVERLLDSRRYVRECRQLGYDPANVAEHIVFLGSATLNRVLNYGVLNTLGNDLKLYPDRLSSPEADIYRDDIIAFLKDEKVAQL